MPYQKRQVKYNILAFVFLFCVSLYRKISLFYFPNDHIRTYIVFVSYAILIFIWVGFAFFRITQRHMRICLLLEGMMMLFGMTLRFVSDTFLSSEMLLTRICGLWIEATILPILLIGLFASMGLAQSDDYRLPVKWYFLLIPVLFMDYIIVTDEKRHFMFYVIPEEMPKPNNIFHPYIGSFLLTAMALFLVFARVFIIYNRNNTRHQRKSLRILIPLFEPILIFISSIGYFLARLQITDAIASIEIIELYAKFYYFEALTWEFYILVGLVPANNCFEEIFKASTVGMQIQRNDGSLLKSENAFDLGKEKIEALKKTGSLSLENGNELHSHEISNGLFIWNEDLSSIKSTISLLNESAEELSKEGEIIMEEIKAKKEEARLFVKNEIYDSMIREVETELDLIQDFLDKWKEKGDEDSLKNILILGVYIKRRCNLRLILEEKKVIPFSDFVISVNDLLKALKKKGTSTEYYQKTIYSNGGSEGIISLDIYANEILSENNNIFSGENLIQKFDEIEKILLN